MHHQSQKKFRGIFVGIPEHREGYLLYIPSKTKIISSYNVVFDVRFSSSLAYTSRPYSEVIAMRPEVTYRPYGTSLREKTVDIITFAHFGEGNILTKTRNDAESGYKYDNE